MILTDGELEAKILSNPDDMLQVYKLRHKVYAEWLQWVPESEYKLETDRYDHFSIHIGVMKNDKLVGIVRVIRCPMPFMLDHEFRACLGSHVIVKGNDVCELTRLAVDPDMDKGLSSRILKVLFHAVEMWCTQNIIRSVYFVIENRFLAVLKRMKYDVCALGEPVTLLPANVQSVACKLNWVVSFASEAPGF